MTFDETVEAFRKIKVEEKHLISPTASIDGRTILSKDTLMTVAKYHINYYDTLEKAIYHVMIYQDGPNKKHAKNKTYIRFYYLEYSNGQSIPYVRGKLRIRENKIRRKRFETVVINKVRKDLHSLNHQTGYKNRVKRVIHFLQ
ncbi:hypothetical protein H8B15_04325 [Hymenobacter sp. BT507]|uniref:Uncharacterized protein n=1 Tax=Hymenobacter citatus TaxID=2763506 RepID=A0ABR7MGD2_9BACT|nr:hypothetical protein [Hymenobacter citatus]MBC6610132.1 hypothetical protein [Hymenobacter citatus]